MSICVYACAHLYPTCAAVAGVKKRVSDPMRLKLHLLVSHWTLVLEAELRHSAKVHKILKASG